MLRKLAGGRVLRRVLRRGSQKRGFRRLPSSDLVLWTTGLGALLLSSPEGHVHISCSTVGPATARELAAEHQARNAGTYIAAPIFARPDGLARREAHIPVSVPLSVVDRCLPLLRPTAECAVARR